MNEKRPMIQVGQESPRLMNDEEYAEYMSDIERHSESAGIPTPEERLTALEMENAYLKEALNLLLEGVTDDV